LVSARFSLETKGKAAYSAKVSEDYKVGPERTFLTQNQLHELLDSDQARQLVEGAEERGYLEAAELEAFALEHELNEEDVEELTPSSSGSGSRYGKLPPKRSPSRRSRSRRRRSPKRTSCPGPPTACSSSSPTSAATSC